MLRGVNLGGWLALEKWMTPTLFEGTKAQDETYFCQELGEDRAKERLKTFRDTFITRRDFAEIADKGFNAVRIPVPFFLFEDIGPYVHCYEYLDKAFDWAEEMGLKILIDLHTAPGGHNGTDNSGIMGICLWSTRQDCVEYTLNVLEKLAAKYRTGAPGTLYLSKADLARKPGDFLKAFPEITVADTPGELSDGFLLKYGDIEINCAFAALMNASREDLKAIAAEKLFS